MRNIGGTPRLLTLVMLALLTLGIAGPAFAAGSPTTVSAGITASRGSLLPPTVALHAQGMPSDGSRSLHVVAASGECP
jgi:hypothetical protein